MWEVNLIQAYYDHEGIWCGMSTPVILESKFGDTQAVLKEIKTFLSEQGDTDPLTIEDHQIDTLWEKARQDPRCDQELALRTDDYVSDEPEDEFEGVVQIQLWVKYNIEKSREKLEAQQDPPAPQTEQLELF